jgi:hypothetical protein
MKKRVAPLTEKFLRKHYSITGTVKGWFFKLEETSNNVFRVEGTDIYGRKVSRTGYGDSDALLRQCEADAEYILSQLTAKS